MLTASGLFLLSFIGCATSATQTRCFPTSEGEGGSLCFIQPDPLVSLPWSSAMDWCKDIGATLPTPDDYTQHNIYANALDYLGLHTETMWLGANSTYDPNNWHWANGTRFTGTIENGNVAGKSQAYIVRNGTNVKFVAASPFESHGYICNGLSSELRCADYPDSFWSGRSCLTKYPSFAASSYEAWQSCDLEGLATVDNLDEFARWMDDSQIFWIGLRSAWWTWYDIVAGTSREVIDNDFGDDNVPNVTSGECLASFRNNRFNVFWINQNCATNLPFVCQKSVNSSASITTTRSSASTSAATTSSSTARTSISSTTTTTPATPTITTQPTSSIPVATTPASVTTTTTTPNSTPKTTASSLASTTTTSTSNSFMTPATSGGTVDSSEGTADATTRQISDNKSTLTNYDLAIGLAVGAILFLLAILWLALLTAYGYRKIREANESLKLLQSPETTSIGSYDNIEFRNASGNAARRVHPHPM